MLLYGRFCEPGEGLNGGAELGILPGLGEESHSSLKGEEDHNYNHHQKIQGKGELLTLPCDSVCSSSLTVVLNFRQDAAAAAVAGPTLMTVRFSLL